MQFKLVISCLLILVVVGCKKAGNTSDNELPKDFITFYEQFHTDSIFQMAHIQFPLSGLPANSFEMGIQDTVFTWNPSNWIMHKPFNSHDNTYIREFTVLNPTIVIEKIYLNTKAFGMERRFSKDNDGWKLIYFVSLNRMKPNDLYASPEDNADDQEEPVEAEGQDTEMAE